jgi:peptide deformylase
MKKATIILFGDPALRERALPIKAFHRKLHDLIDTIKLTLGETEDAAALAASQIAVAKRITVIDYQGEYFEMVNPEILDQSGEAEAWEGCLSFPGYSGIVKRAQTVTVKYRDRHGKEYIIERSGPMARCIQHEIDHLDGVLYIDRMDEDDFVVNDEKKTKIPVKGLLKTSLRKNP